MATHQPDPSLNDLNDQLGRVRGRVAHLSRELQAAREELETLERRIQEAGRSANSAVPPVIGAGLATGTVNASSSLAEKLTLFSQRFAGRRDAYATRWVSRKTGKSGWSPAVKGGFYTDQKSDADLLALTSTVLEQHLRGTDDGKPELHVGLYPLGTDDQCKVLVSDFDGKSWRDDAAAYARACREAGCPTLAEISRSGDGAHVWLFFDDWLPAITARKAGMVLLRRAMQINDDLSLGSYDRFFPSQDVLPSQSAGRMRLGNLIALPLQGNCRRRGTTVFADPTSWEAFPDQFEALSATALVPRKMVDGLAAETAILELGPSASVHLPKRPLRAELKLGLTGKTIEIRRDSMLHIPTDVLPSAFVIELKHRASLANPEFYRRQAQRFNTFGVPRVVTCFEHESSELRLPRGLADETRRLLTESGAKVRIRQKGQRPKKHQVSFTGELRPEQRQAVRALLDHRDGVLVAPPGSGKTVMACSLIAERSVSTAVLVNRAELLHQWRERLTSFLNIEDHQIGQFGNGRKKRKGLIDLIMMQSISRRDADPGILEEYGQIIVDECHAIAAPSTEAAIKQVNAKYWVGLTATPFRADQMDGLITMQCGPIRYEMETPTGQDRRLVVHQTVFTTEEPGTDGPSIQAIYSELSVNKARNGLIAEEVLKASAAQRNCMVLTNRVEHLKALRELLGSTASCEVFALHGQLRPLDRREVREAIAAASDADRRFILLAIDKVAGEGLDIPVLDTLFLTMPVSFKGRVIQQAGRVTRGPGQGRGTAVVHDFRDSQVPLLERMHRRRLKTLAAEGFRQEATPTLGIQMAAAPKDRRDLRGQIV